MKDLDQVTVITVLSLEMPLCHTQCTLLQEPASKH